MARARISRTREEVLEGVTVVDGYVWATCSNCGGSGNYPSSCIPPGRCRLYCWLYRTRETFGKRPIPVDKYVRREQEADRREARRQREWKAKEAEREARKAERTARAVQPDGRIHRLAVAYGVDLDTGNVVGPYSGTANMVGSLCWDWIERGELTDAQWGLVDKALGWAAERQACEERARMAQPLEVGGKYTHTATLRDVRRILDGGWRGGGTVLYKWETSEGHRLAHFTNTNPLGDVLTARWAKADSEDNGRQVLGDLVGEAFEVTYTAKTAKEWQGLPEYTVVRVKVKEATSA